MDIRMAPMKPLAYRASHDLYSVKLSIICLSGSFKLTAHPQLGWIIVCRLTSNTYLDG